MEFSLFVSGYQKNLSSTGFLLDNNPDLELVSSTNVSDCLCLCFCSSFRIVSVSVYLDYKGAGELPKSSDLFLFLYLGYKICQIRISSTLEERNNCQSFLRHGAKMVERV